MSIQSFAEKLLADVDIVFSREANNLLNEARQHSGKESYVAGRMDGITEMVGLIKSTYTLFVKPDQEDAEDDSKPLY